MTVVVAGKVVLDVPSGLLFAIALFLSYRLIKTERVRKDSMLEGIRNQRDDLIQSAKKRPREQTRKGAVSKMVLRESF